MRHYKYTAHHTNSSRGGGGGLPYERDGYARRKIRIKPLKETKLGVAQALLTSKGDHAKTEGQIGAIVILIALKI